MAYMERDGTKTVRRQLRQAVRSALGTSSDGAPNAERAIRAAMSLSEIVNYATNGKLRLMLVGREPGGDVAVAFHEAIQEARTKRDPEAARILAEMRR